jgi:hypothetical protein
VSSSNSLAVQLADAIHQEAVRAGAAAPGVRGSDWRLAVVATVGTTGTITTTDGIVARRAEAYQGPAVGDVIRISVSGSGAWIAEGRQAPADDSDAWHALTLTSPWVNYGSTYQTARYRYAGGGVVMVQGLVATGGNSVSGTSNIASALPAGLRPPAGLVWPAIRDGNVVRQLEITTGGIIRATTLPAGAIAYMSINLQFTTF